MEKASACSENTLSDLASKVLGNASSPPSLQTVTATAQQTACDASSSLQRVLHFNDLPPWMQLDPHIRLGYRRQLNSFRECFRSLFYTHNELVNTWSHLLPACAFLALLLGLDVSTFYTTEKSVSLKDKAILQLYVACSTVMLFFSAFFHNTSAHSPDVAQRTLKMDYLGIVLTISSTCITSTYFGYYNNPRLQTLYISFTVICGTAVFRSVMGKHADGPGAAAWRSIVFCALAASGWVAIAHAGISGGMEGLASFPLYHSVITISLYLLGVFFYVTRLPESHWPETFDVWGASHQIFHVLIAIGQFVFLVGLREVLLKNYV